MQQVMNAAHATDRTNQPKYHDLELQYPILNGKTSAVLSVGASSTFYVPESAC